jgi:hypothetical protein
MAKKKYRVYKSGGTQGRVINPTAQFLARAQEGMQQPSEEEMAMMQQQAMQQQQGQPQMQQQGGQDQMMQQLVAAIGQAMQNGAQPEEVVAKLLQDQVEPEMVAEALLELGMPMEEVDQLMASVIQQLEGGQEQGQPSEEEMMAMQQQQMAEQAPMSKGGYVKKRLKMAQEGMEQRGAKGSNTNLAAEDNTNNVSALIDFSKNNALKNQYEQEYDQMQGDQGMMPEARLGREARQERRQIRQDERTDRTEMRQAARTARQANRLANRAVRQVSSPFGRVPGFSAYSPSPFMGSSIRLEDVERGLFGRLKNFKMSIDGLGFPSRFSEGMFMNAMHNPYGMPAGQSRIVNMITKPGQVIDQKVVEKDEQIKFKQNVDAEGSGGSDDNALANQLLYNQLEAMKNRVGNIALETGTGDDDSDNSDAGGLPSETVPVLVNSEDAKTETNDDAVMYWLLGGLAGTLIIGDLLISRAQLKKAVANGAKTLEEAAAMEGTKATSEQVKAASKGPTFRERMRAKVQARPQMRNPLSGKFQAKPQTVRGYAGQKSMNLLRNTYKYGYKKPKVATVSRFKKIASPLLRFVSKGKIKLEDGGYVDMMDQDYGNPDLYRFTGGGDYDYFADGGYYENGGEYEPFKSTYQGPLTEADQTSLDNQYATTAIPEIPFASATKPNYRTTLSDEEAQENEAYRRKLFENYARSGSSNVAFESNRGNKSVGYTGYNDNMLRDAKYYADTDMNSKEGQILKARDDMEYYIDNNLYDTVEPDKDEKLNDYRKKLSTLRSQAYGGSAQPQYEDVNDPYMPYMQDGGYILMADDGYQVGPDTVTGTDKDTLNEKYMSSADDRFENPTQELYQSLSPEQREMYKAEYLRRQKAGYGQRGYGMMGYGQQPYRRGLFNTVMGINAPAAIQRRQYLTQMAGPTYADGTPVIGGALPEGYHLRTGSAKDGEAGIVYNTNNLRDRVFGRKDAAGNRVRVPRKTISYYFEGPNDTTPSLAGGDNAISNFKINPASDVQPTPQPAGPANDPGREGFNADSDGNNIPDYFQYENTAPGMREAEEMNNASAERMSLADDRVTPNLPVSKQQSRKNKRVNNRKERKSNRDFNKIGREAKRTYKGKNAPLSEEGEARMNQGYQYGGYQEGDEVYMSPEEVAQFMAAGGQIEFL